MVVSSHAAAVDKLVDKVLFPHDPSSEGVYRWSEGSILNVDGQKHLMMLMSAFGHGGHDGSEGVILEFHSHDCGLTWTPLEEARVFQENIGKQNVMSPSLLRLKDGNILCFFLVTNSLVDAGPWVKRSSDHGKTWSDPVRLPYEGYGGPANDRAIQLAGGRVILPCWVSMDKLGSTHAYCFYSDDRGKSWQKTNLISVPKGSTGRKTDPAAEEPAVIELKDGRLMMFMRTYLGSIYLSYSDDEAATWSKPVSSGIPSAGAMPTLARMPDGSILLIWNWGPEDEISGPWPRKYLACAVSRDEGKTFSHEFQGSTANNIVTIGNAAGVTAVYQDPDAAEESKRWVMWGKQTRPGEDGIPANYAVYRFYSPDGIHWTRERSEPNLPCHYPDVVLGGVMGDAGSTFWLPSLGKHVGIHQTVHNPEQGTIDQGFAISTDTVTWVRPFHGNPVLPLGPEGAFDSEMIQATGQILEKDDTWWLYYAGSPWIHSDPESGEYYEAIGLAQMPAGRIVSADAGAEGGTFTTAPITFVGRQLQINALTNPGGTILVELLDTEGRPLDGFSVSDPFSGDALHHVVTFNGEADLSALAGQTIALRFQIEDGGLYAFEILNLLGDLNSDGFIGGADLDIVPGFWGQIVTPGNKLHGDPSADGFMGGANSDWVRAHWGEGTSPIASGLPEPTTIGLLLSGIAAVLLARRRGSWRFVDTGIALDGVPPALRGICSMQWSARCSGFMTFWGFGILVLAVLVSERRELLAAEASRGGITDVTRGKADLTTPLGTPPGKVWRYGLGFPFQVGPKTAGLFCNIRLEGTPYGDFEIGTDLIPFDDLAEIDASRAIAISRSTHGVDPKTRKPYVMAKYPVIGGFVPYGAKRADGSAYPFVGSGFGMCQVCPYPGNFAQPLPPDAKLHYSLELHQFSYDGNRFQATPPVRVESIQFPDAWQGYAPGLTWAIPGGDHLLFPMSCFKAGASRQEGVAGVARFRFDGTQWQPVGFVAVTDPSSRWFEPSLIRDVDGRLLFSARGGRRGSVADVRLWRSSDNGKTWKQVFYRQGARTGTPIVLNRASDGTPYLATSTALGTDRRILDIVPVNDKRTGLQERLVARDSHAEFGPPPGSDRWKVDHGVGAVVRLGDGRWHGILVYRVMDQGENYGKPPAPQTGCYVEEVVCRGTAHPSWKFDE